MASLSNSTFLCPSSRVKIVALKQLELQILLRPRQKIIVEII